MDEVNMALTNKSIIDQRWATCSGCDQLDTIMNSCKSCNCPIDSLIGAAYMKCPLSKWQSYQDPAAYTEIVDSISYATEIIHG